MGDRRRRTGRVCARRTSGRGGTNDNALLLLQLMVYLRSPEPNQRGPFSAETKGNRFIYGSLSAADRQSSQLDRVL